MSHSKLYLRSFNFFKYKKYPFSKKKKYFWKKNRYQGEIFQYATNVRKFQKFYYYGLENLVLLKFLEFFEKIKLLEISEEF